MDITLFVELLILYSAYPTIVLKLSSPTIIPNLIELCIRLPKAIPEEPAGEIPIKKS